MYKDDYISAFGKLAPSEEWMTDTLAKMRAAEAEQEAPGATGRPALRVSGKKRDDLQAIIAFVKTLGIDQPLQFVNFRD